VKKSNYFYFPLKFDTDILNALFLPLIFNICPFFISGKPYTKNFKKEIKRKKFIFFKIPTQNTRNLAFIVYLPKVFFTYPILLRNSTTVTSGKTTCRISITDMDIMRYYKKIQRQQYFFFLLLNYHYCYFLNTNYIHFKF